MKSTFSDDGSFPTLFGHEGRWKPGDQTSNMYCVDDGYTDSCGVVCVVDRKNEIRPYYTAKSIKYSQEHNDDNPLKLGYYDKEACKKLVIYDCKPQDNISIINKYVESGQQPSETIVNAIDAIIQSKDAQKIEGYHRIFAFSQKDKRAQQVYQTYKMLTESQNEINTSNQPTQNQTMIELNSIHSINTPCGGCF